MSIRLAAERIAQSLQNDEWSYHENADERYLLRKGMTLCVHLNGSVRIGDGSYLPRERVPINWSERRMLARVAKERLQIIVANIANTPSAQVRIGKNDSSAESDRVEPSNPSDFAAGGEP